MTRPPADLLLQHLRRLAGRDTAAGGSDAELLRRFLAAADEAAFTAIVHRHGAMVWQVCRAALGRPEDAEDVFQATFLVLARKAGAVRKPQSLACWLHGVALGLARKVRERNLRRRNADLALDQVPARPLDDLTWRELRQVLHEELGQLPEKNRLPILLCHLEGRTQDEAARALGWSLGCLRGRLLRGRELLRRRLARRGLAPAVPLLASALFPDAVAAIPPEPLVAALARSVAALARHEVIPAGGPSNLAERFLRDSAPSWKRLAATLAILLVPLLGVVGLLVHLAAAAPGAPQRADQAPADHAKNPVAVPDARGEGQPVLKDQLGDALPAGALLRLGTLRFRSGSVICSLAFTGDGKTLLCAGWHRAIGRWDVQTGAEQQTWPGTQDGFLDAAVSADGTTLVGGSVGGKVHVWDLTAGKRIKELAVPGGKTIRVVAVTPDGRTAAVAGDDNVVRLLDLAAGAEPRVLVVYKQQPRSLAFSPDGKLLASSAYDGTACVHEWATGKEVFRPQAKKGVLLSLHFSSDGKTLLAGEEKAVSIWDAATGQLKRRIEGVEEDVSVVRFAPDGMTFAGGTSNGRVYLWESAGGKQLLRIKAHADNVHALAFRPDGAVLASGGSEQGVFLWDTKSGKQLNTLVGHLERITAVAVAPGGKVIATAGWDHCVRLWDADTGKELHRLAWTPREDLPFGTVKAVLALHFSPDGKWLAAGGYEGKLWLWDLATGQPMRTFPGIFAALSPDGKHLATADWGGAVQLYETAGGKEIRQFKGHLSGFESLHFTPDGQTLVTVSVGQSLGVRNEGGEGDRQTIWLWDVATGKVRLRFGGEFGPGAVAVSPDGRVLSATGLGEEGVHLWELATGKERAVLRGHGDDIFATAFSPDGTYLASGSMDNTVRLWRLPGGEPAHTLTGHRGWILALAFSPDGKKLVSGSQDTTGLVWQLPAAPALKGVKLTPAELGNLWDELASADAKAAYRAIAKLAAAPVQAASFLGEKLRPVPATDDKLLIRLIADLDGSDFAARQKSTAALERFADLAVPQLRAALEKPPSLEAARRIEKIMDTIATQPLPAEQLRDLRAVEALETIANAEARGVLEVLGRGAPGAHLTRDARAALLRLAKRPPGN
jgi:RNA polymerase sigma factor (sigma-70 family)